MTRSIDRMSRSAIEGMSADDLKAIIVEVLDERRSIGEEQHKLDHQFLHDVRPFLTDWIDSQRLKQQRYETLRNTVIGGLIVAILGWVGAQAISFLIGRTHGG